MLNRILCPFHKENTPSLILYETHYHCFACEAHGPLSELDLVGVENIYPMKRDREDIAATFDYIKTLPTKLIRGFMLPYDESGYYIVYPNTTYYVKRLWGAADNCKYRGPKGHKKPLYIARESKPAFTLFIVEGQLNALTLAECAFNSYSSIVSPGGAGDFNKPDYIKYYLQSDKISIIVDKDAAGVAAARVLKNTLALHRKRSSILALDQDLNSLYTELPNGRTAVYEKAQEALALL